MQKNILKLSLIILIIFFVFIFFKIKSQTTPISEPISENQQIKFVNINSVSLKVEIAHTREEQERGLSGRAELKEDEGMLFVFDKLNKNYFWMKNMNFPIDIIWLDESNRIIYIAKSVSPSTYPKLFGPNAPSLYVLETIAGFSEKNKIKIGDKVNFLY